MRNKKRNENEIIFLTLDIFHKLINKKQRNK